MTDLATSAAENAGLSYMTAEEMQAKVFRLTGFQHPAFDQFADVLGRYDPATGLRTVDRPTLVSVLFMQKVAGQVADMVLERETFLSDDERVVFVGVDLAQSPDDAALAAFIARLATRWLAWPLGDASAAQMAAVFRRAEPDRGTPAAYRDVIASCLEHGGLYYY